MQARAFRLNLKPFREAYHYLVLIQYELCQGPYRNAFQVLIDDVLIIYEEIDAFRDQIEALERHEPPDQLTTQPASGQPGKRFPIARYSRSCYLPKVLASLSLAS